MGESCSDSWSESRTYSLQVMAFENEYWLRRGRDGADAAPKHEPTVAN
jgi:hypothetical protein